MTQPVAYLDNNATTRATPEVAEAVGHWLTEAWGNPSSLHRLGAAAARALEDAREAVARLVGAEAREVVFTSGGTEANNLAVLGAARARRRRGEHVVTTAVEHPCVLGACAALEAEGFRVTYVGVDGEGRLDPAAVVDAIEDDTVLVSVMHVQNETGAVFPIEAVARKAKARSRKLLVHSDGVQAAGKVPPPGAAVDLYAVSGHKIHAPKGIGALVVRGKARVLPLLHGGGQERGIRSGTEPLPAIVGLGVAARQAREARGLWARDGALADLAARLRGGIEARGGVLNSPSDALPSTVNASFPGAPAEPLLHALEARGVYASTGSACASRRGQRSPVLQAMGLSEARVDSALRFSLARATTGEEVDAALEALGAALADVGARSAAGS